ncbi:MAG: glycosyltransferase family 2 protein [Candidatus Vecturithrix sp.]|jgi:glycosyltransferase involved in cell wall biosynthesis|nr:glycosyltransferase family 2 protein [Candidatus Vecturithrix sp.]
MMKKVKISVIIPCFNEEKTIGNIVKKILSLYPDFEVIVVDDGSTDQTVKMAMDAGAITIRHPYNIGNGAAVKSGIRKAKGDIFVFMDADGQHDPKDISLLLDSISDYDMIVGARSKEQQATIFRGFGNYLCNVVASYVAKFRVRDLTSGFRCVKASVARQFLYLLPNQYSYPTTSTLYILRTGRSLKYIDINVSTRLAGKSHIKLFRDGIRFFLIIIKICTLFSPFRVFLPLSFIVFITGLCYYIYTYLAWGRFTNMSALMFTTAIIVFMIGLVSEQICQIVYERSEKSSNRE